MIKRVISDLLIKTCIHLIGVVRWLPLKLAARNPEKSQIRILLSILHDNQNTQFGIAHRFASINSIRDFQSNIAIQSADSAKQAIDRQRHSNQAVLTRDQVILYTQTSGTTGEPKYIPVTTQALSDYKKQQQLASFHFYRNCKQAFHGKVLAIVSPAIEGYFDNGIPYGSASGHIHRSMPSLIRNNYVVPSEVFKIKDYDIKYLTILCLALSTHDITYIACANPSTLVRMLTLANQQLPRIVASIKSGDLSTILINEPTLIGKISKNLQPNPQRASELERIGRQQGALGLIDFWPKLKLITTWTGGNCAIALASLTKHLPSRVKIMDIGYIASEFRATITIDADNQSGLPLLKDHFYEFIEVDAWDRGDRSTQMLSQLRLGKSYYIIVTTKTGLYRYFINDIVTVTGFFAKTPLVKFEQKGKGVTNITGEKLYESQVVDAVNTTLTKTNLNSTFTMTLADVSNSRYQVYIETEATDRLSASAIADNLDKALKIRNIEYQNKRASGRLQPLEVFWLKPGAFESYKQHCLRCGQREAQFKLVSLQYRHDFNYAFDHWRHS